MKLEDIGFYTLSDKRVGEVSKTSNLKRCELILTDKCNLKCPYCRGVEEKFKGDLPLSQAQYILQLWVDQGLENVRFSGGEPTLYPELKQLIKECKNAGVKRIAISTNGTQSLDTYKELVDVGVNDFSISLDGGCCSVSDKMTGGVQTFEIVSNNIKYLSWYNYVTVGVVFNEINVNFAVETVKYIDSLNPSDIRIISSAQYNKALNNLTNLPGDILNRHPILRYRINNYKDKRNVRGIKASDCTKCHLVKDDVAVMKNYHFPCIIYLREGGKPIGKMGERFREERFKWFEKHNTHFDKICAKNCLDVCIDYNNKCDELYNT
jgi:molybdenum cofactor biosynthesis enzyme MoaA